MRGERMGDGVDDAIRRVTTLLASNRPFDDRMAAMCHEVIDMLTCDRSSVLLWDGSMFLARFNAGNPPEIAAIFQTLRIPHHDVVIEQLRNTRDPLVINDARHHSGFRRFAQLADVDSLVLAPMFDADDEIVGVITAEYCGREDRFDVRDGEAVQAIARLASSVLRDARIERETQVPEVGVLEAVAGERKRIGQEIHDDALQRVFTLYLRLQTIRDQMTDATVRSALDDLIADSRELAESLRNVTDSTAAD